MFSHRDVSCFKDGDAVGVLSHRAGATMQIKKPTTFLGGTLPGGGLGVSWSFMVARWRSSKSSVACTRAG